MSLKWVLLLLLLLPTTLQFPQSGAFIIGPIVMKLRQDVHYAIPYSCFSSFLVSSDRDSARRPPIAKFATFPDLVYSLLVQSF